MSEKDKAEKRKQSKKKKLEDLQKYNKFTFTKEEVQEALELSMGNVSRAARLLVNADGTAVSRSTLDLAIAKFGIKYYSDMVKGKIAKEALEIVQDKAVAERDQKCLFKILDTWGKYIDFVEPDKKVDVNMSIDPWGDVLKSIDTQRKAEESDSE